MAFDVRFIAEDGDYRTYEAVVGMEARVADAGSADHHFGRFENIEWRLELSPGEFVTVHRSLRPVRIVDPGGHGGEE